MAKNNVEDPPLYLSNNKDLTVYMTSKEIVVNFFNVERRIKIDPNDPNPLATATKLHEELIKVLVAYRFGSVVKVNETSASAHSPFIAKFDTTDNNKVDPVSKLYKLYHSLFGTVRKYMRSK